MQLATELNQYWQSGVNRKSCYEQIQCAQQKETWQLQIALIYIYIGDGATAADYRGVALLL